MSTTPSPIDTSLEVKFYLHYIKFIPYVDSVKQNSNDILFDILTFLNQEHLKGRAYAIDRNKNRPELDKREMFMNNPVRIAREKRFKCSMALLKDKSLMLKKADTLELVPYDKAAGLIAEVTHFYIDFSVFPAIICAQFNNEGPRISDIEYYFRNLASKLNLAKGCQTTTSLYAPIDTTLESLHNVLNIELKLKPQTIAQLDNEMKGGLIENIAIIGNRLKPNFIKIEAMFQTPGGKVKSKYLNKEANSLITSFLKKFQERPDYIDQFEEFEIKFVDKEGNDDVFNLIKGKREISVKVNRNEHMTTTKYYDLILDEFDTFVQTHK